MNISTLANNNAGRIIVIAGPTAAGKSVLALNLARKLKAEGKLAAIICADSITHYQGFDIGSAKPSLQERAEIPHYLVDISAAAADFTAGDFQRGAEAAIAEIHACGGLPLLVGGSGFYLKALLQGMAIEENISTKLEIRAALEKRQQEQGIEVLYEEMLVQDPVLLGRIHPKDTYRILRALEAMQLQGKKWSELNQAAAARPSRWLHDYFVVDHPALKERIIERTQSMLAKGLVAECESLLAQGCPKTAKPFQSVGYRQCLDFLEGKLASMEELQAAIVLATRKLAKAQRTWFRGQAKNATWISPDASGLERLYQSIERPC